jgi:hypothetical protein
MTYAQKLWSRRARSEWKPNCPGLMLRTCASGRKSYCGFQYPADREYVAAPDWNPEPICGGGLHGLLKADTWYWLDANGNFEEVA